MEKSDLLINDYIKQNVELVTKESLNQDYLLHISFLKTSFLIPNISLRAAKTEDNTLPKIYTSTNLFGCISGYYSFDLKFTRDTRIVNTKNFKNEPKFYIYKIDFDIALKPNNKLVFDADYTDEHWLITYNKETLRYKTENIGKLILADYTLNLAKNNFPNIYFTFYLELLKDTFIEKNKPIQKGYYKLIVSKKYNSQVKFDLFYLESIEKIDKDTYEENVKNKVFSLEKNILYW